MVKCKEEAGPGVAVDASQAAEANKVGAAPTQADTQTENVSKEMIE